MGLNLPCLLGPFAVDAEGRLSPSEPDRPAGFGFRWRERAMRAQLGAAGAADTLAMAGAGTLAMQATLGRVPSTASHDQAMLRPHSFATVRGLQGGLPEAWRVQLMPDHRVILRTEAVVALPITTEALLVEITQFLLGLSPYLDLLDELGAVPGFAEPGQGEGASRDEGSPGAGGSVSI